GVRERPRARLLEPSALVRAARAILGCFGAFGTQLRPPRSQRLVRRRRREIPLLDAAGCALQRNRLQRQPASRAEGHVELLRRPRLPLHPPLEPDGLLRQLPLRRVRSDAAARQSGDPGLHRCRAGPGRRLPPFSAAKQAGQRWTAAAVQLRIKKAASRAAFSNRGLAPRPSGCSRPASPLAPEPRRNSPSVLPSGS